MIRCAVLLLGTMLATSAYAADEVSLVGTWTGHRERIAKEDGFREGTATLVVTEQQGRTFKGYLNRANADGDVKEELWGAFTPDAQLMVGADEEGFYAFTLIDDDTLDYCYAEAGASPRSVCARLEREK